MGVHTSERMHIPGGMNVAGSMIVGRTARTDVQREIQDKQRLWLLEVLAAVKLKPSQLATQAGVSDTTLTRLLNSDTYKGVLNAATIERIKSTFRVPGPEEYASSRGQGLIGLNEAVRFDARSQHDLAGVVSAILRGRANVEPWLLKTMALEAAGYIPGDIVFVEALADGQMPRPQDAVCAQVVDYSHGSAETVWRIWDPPFLVAASIDRTAYKPLLVDGERVKIAGVIRESYRPRSRSDLR